MRETLKARQAEILKCLITSSTPLDIAFFQGKFHKGERTIRYDIGQLKEICSAHRIEIRYQTKKGYYIPASQKTECSQFLVQSEVQTKDGLIGKDEEERYQKIFLYLFVQKSHVTAERIAEAYFVSRSTLTRFLGKMESYFENQFFLDARKSMGYRLEGDELVLRRLAAQIIAALFRGSYMAEDWYMLLPDEAEGQNHAGRYFGDQQKHQADERQVQRLDFQYVLFEFAQLLYRQVDSPVFGKACFSG